MKAKAENPNETKEDEEEAEEVEEKKEKKVRSGGGTGIMSTVTFASLNLLEKTFSAIQELGFQHMTQSNSTSVDRKRCAWSCKDRFWEDFCVSSAFRKQKMEDSSLPRAVIRAVWKSLAVNAVFAGVNTIASYMGPFLITNFVNYLLRKHDDSSVHHGLNFAFVFLIAKTMESLSQRQWYFGAQIIGVRVRAALTVLIYKKSISIKYSGPSNGKMINLVNVDVERIGDFCWYIHGIWLLPLQVILALVVLYMNLGAAPAAAALIATILIMICNTPLANMQERLHSKMMEAKDSRIKVTAETLRSMRVLKLHS